MIKKIISVALCFSVILCFSQNALAAVKTEDPQDNIIYRNDTVVTAATSEQMAEHEDFGFQSPGGQYFQNGFSGISIKNMILSMCDEIKNEQIGDMVVRTYSSEQLKNNLGNCAEITEISSIGDALYISYL